MAIYGNVKIGRKKAERGKRKAEMLPGHPGGADKADDVDNQ